ncbi:MAG: MlaD family protein [Acidobacteriota bacterium]
MSQAIKVGLFVTLCLVVLGVLIFRIEDLRLGGDGQRVVVLFDSVAGLNEKAPVRVAGVRVGTVEEIGLEGRQARVVVVLDQEVALTEGSSAAIANAGLLGDKYIELVPGAVGGPTLPADTVLVGTTPVSFDEALQRFDSLGQKLGNVAGDVTAEGDLGQSIRRLLDNLEATSADIRELVASNRSQVDSTMANFERFSTALADELPKLTAQIQAVLAQVDSVVSENRGDLQGSLANIREVTERMQASVDNLNDISGQIRSGEGTLGKLVYDDAAHDSLVDTLNAVETGVGSLNDTLGRVQKLELELGLEATTYVDLDEEGGAAFRARLSSHPRRSYYLGLVDTPQGKVDEETRTIITTRPDGTVETTVIEEQVREEDFTLTAMLGYQLGDFELRAGLIESAGGAGLDYHLFDRKLIVSLEAFDFDRPNDLDPHLRFTARYLINPNILLIGGYDDPLADEFESVFIGAGIRWKDEDLKYLLGSIPSF